MGEIDLRWVEEDKLGIEVQVGAVIIHQRDHLRREEWKTLIMYPDELRALVKLLDRDELTAPQESGSKASDVSEPVNPDGK